jgi:hypothetical protein
VLYFEKEHEPEVNKYIITHYHYIQKVLGMRGLQLLYLSVIKQLEKLDINIASAFDYAYPDLFLGANHVQQENIEQWVKDIDFAELYNIFGSTLEIPELPLPGFILCLKDKMIQRINLRITQFFLFRGKRKYQSGRKLNTIYPWWVLVQMNLLIGWFITEFYILSKAYKCIISFFGIRVIFNFKKIVWNS